jgi:dipeptidase E
MTTHIRLYLSSFRVGNRPDELLALLPEGRRTAVICNSIDCYDGEGRASGVKRELDELAGLGLEPVDVDLRDHFGDTAGLRERLEAFDLVWVRGGNAFILRRAMSYSGADEILTDLITNGVVAYGGYSAGVVVLAPHIRGAELVDDPDAVPAGYRPEVIWDGLGLLPYCVLPHFRSAHPESRAVDEVMERYLEEHVPFIALRDGQAIVWDGGAERVVS